MRCHVNITGQLADWLESYAHTLELNVWTSTTALKASQDAEKKWLVTVKRGDDQERILRVSHLGKALALAG